MKINYKTLECAGGGIFERDRYDPLSLFEPTKTYVTRTSV